MGCELLYGGAALGYPGTLDEYLIVDNVRECGGCKCEENSDLHIEELECILKICESIKGSGEVQWLREAVPEAMVVIVGKNAKARCGPKARRVQPLIGWPHIANQLHVDALLHEYMRIRQNIDLTCYTQEATYSAY